MACHLARALLTGLFIAAAAGTTNAAPLPLDWHSGPSTVAFRCKAGAQELIARVHAIEHEPGRRTFANTVLALENAVADANDGVAADRALAVVADDPSVQSAADECTSTLASAYAQVVSDPALYAAVNAARKSSTAHTTYDRKLTALWYARLRRSGAALPARYRAEYLRLSLELNDVQARFNQNLGAANETITVNRRAVAGIPNETLATFAPVRGGYRVPVNDATLDVLTYAQDEDVRRSYWYAYTDRAAATNLPLLARAIAIRDRIAHLFGFETWADYQLANRMAQSRTHAERFIDTMTATLATATTAELTAMQNTIATERRDPSAALEPWDVARAQYLLRTAHGFDAETIRQYFPAQHTLDAVLDVFHTLLGVTFSRVDAPDAWAPDVVAYDVRDVTTNELLGTTYFDLYARAHKIVQAREITVFPARRIDGERRGPVTIIVANWPVPPRGRPALLGHDDVVALFRSLGQSVATILATAPYETLSDGFRGDFAAAPAQTFANFAWQPEILKRISSQWRTGEPMPDEAIANLVATRAGDDVYDTMRQLVLARFDLEAHASGSNVNTDVLFARLSAQLLPPLDAPDAHPQAALASLMSGRDAALYAGPWADRYADDLFTAWNHGSLLDPAVGMRYREDILAPARTFEPDIEVKRFLGRRMQPGAYYTELGLPCC